MSKTILEVCCASADFAVAAAGAGADRVELCDNLVEGGTTPSLGALQLAIERVAVPIMAMVRPRGGDFLYSALELDVMLRDIEAFGVAGAEGVVIGVLDAAGRVDRARTRRLVEAARPMSVTFHRAFDLSDSLEDALDTVAELGVDRVLTSAGCASVVEGLDRLSALIEQARGSIVVMPGGGIRPSNIEHVAAVPGVTEIHIGASRRRPSEMAHRHEGVFMGASYDPDEFVVEVADTERISATRERWTAGERPSLEVADG